MSGLRVLHPAACAGHRGPAYTKSVQAYGERVTRCALAKTMAASSAIQASQRFDLSANMPTSQNTTSPLKSSQMPAAKCSRLAKREDDTDVARHRELARLNGRRCRRNSPHAGGRDGLGRDVLVGGFRS